MSRASGIDARKVADQFADRMLQASVLERVAIAVGSTVLALLIGAVIVAASGYDAIEFLFALIYGAFGTLSNTAFTLRQTTIFIITGIAVAVAFRAGVFNIGVQGQFVLGGFAATLVILFIAPALPAGPITAIFVIVVATIVAMAVGGAYAALPGLMKAYADANEVITTIMLNFIATGIVYYLIDAHFKADGAVGTTTPSIPEYVSFPPFMFGSSDFSVIGLSIAIIAVIATLIIMARTTFGYDLITSGYQASAAEYSGVDPKRMIVRTMSFSGMLAGLAGSVFVIMVLGAYIDPNTIQTFGFDAIAVSLLAANNPLGVIPAGLLFGGLDAGGQYIAISLRVPNELVDGIFGLIVLFVAVPELFRILGRYTNLGGDLE